MDQDAEWEVIYNRLRSALGSKGIESAVGDGDFWLVDDNYGFPVHSVGIFNIEIMTPGLAEEIRTILSDYPARPWVVVFKLDIERHRDAPVDVPSDGLRVSRSEIVEEWNPRILKRIFGNAYRWH